VAHALLPSLLSISISPQRKTGKSPSFVLSSNHIAFAAISAHHKKVAHGAEVKSMVAVAMSGRRNTNDLKAKRNSLIRGLQQGPSKFSARPRIKALYDEFADCNQTRRTRKTRRAAPRTPCLPNLVTPSSILGELQVFGRRAHLSREAASIFRLRQAFFSACCPISRLVVQNRKPKTSTAQPTAPLCPSA